jgi:hypothetical protein
MACTREASVTLASLKTENSNGNSPCPSDERNVPAYVLSRPSWQATCLDPRGGVVEPTSCDCVRGALAARGATSRLHLDTSRAGKQTLRTAIQCPALFWVWRLSSSLDEREFTMTMVLRVCAAGIVSWHLDCFSGKCRRGHQGMPPREENDRYD